MIIIGALIIVIIILIIATAKFKVHPFLSLIVSSIIMGFVGQLEGSIIIEKISEGFGNTLKSIGIIIAFGTIIGVYLEKTGGAQQMANSIIKMIGEKRSALAMNITGYIVSIPVFCDSGFIILSSLNKALSKKTGIPILALAIALSTGLYVTHVFVPPTPGPLAAAATIGADIGLVILLGIVVAIPTSLVGLGWAIYSSKKNTTIGQVISEIKEDTEDLPNARISFTPIVVPIILIALKSIAEYPTEPFGQGIFTEFLKIMGNPIIALLIGVFISLKIKKQNKETHFDWFAEGLKNAGVIILITGAGGAFGNILRATDISNTIQNIFGEMQVGIVLPFILAAILKSAQGSSTVSIITTAAIISPMLVPMGLEAPLSRALVVLAIGAGAMTVSHINDSYFWVVTQFTGIETSTALKSHTIATLLQGLSAILIILIIKVAFV